MSKAKYWKGIAAGVIILAVILAAAAGAYMFLKENVKEYEKTVRRLFSLFLIFLFSYNFF